METPEKTIVDDLARSLALSLGASPDVAVVLGSGWKERARDLLSDPKILPLAELEHWPQPKVQGHGAELSLGGFEDQRVLLVSGRVHAYEGYPARVLVRGVRALVRWGTKRVLLLNAAGSTREDRPPGSLMPLSDHINYGLPNPLAAHHTEDGKALFLDLVDLYDPAWRARLRVAEPDLDWGVYVGMSGPTYETPAEVRAMTALGADAVGMSTVPEALAARAAGARVMAVSLISNYAAGVGGSRPSHQEVLDTAAAHGERAAEVLAAAIRAAPR